MMKKPELKERDIKRHSDTVDDIVIFSYGNKNHPKASNPTYWYEYYFTSCEHNLEILLLFIDYVSILYTLIVQNCHFKVCGDRAIVDVFRDATEIGGQC